MSKKRRIGLDKWHLGKELNDYKYHKQKKQAPDGLGYLHELEYVKPGKSRKVNKAQRRRCKHEYKETDRSIRLGFIFINSKCINCNKSKFKIEKLD